MKDKNPWIEYLEEDRKVLELLKDSGLFRAICFHAQQLVEKLLKAILYEQRKEIPKTHDLISLYRRSGVREAIDIGGLRFLSDVYVESRYPPDLGLLPGEVPDEEDARRAYELAMEIYEALKKYIM